MESNCPLCSSQKISKIEMFYVRDLLKLYGNDLRGLVSENFKGVDAIACLQCQDCDLIFFDPMITGSEEFYNEKQSRSTKYYREEKHEYNIAKAYIKPSDKVLEIGCGKGEFFKYIHPDYYLGLEFSSDAIKKAEEAGINVKREMIEEHALKKQNFYDVVCFFQVLEHVSNVGEFINNTLKVLKSGGLLIFSVPNNDSYLSLFSNSIPNLPPHHVTRWPIKTMYSIEKIYQLDLIDLDLEPLSDFHLNDFALAVCLKAVKTFLKDDYPLVDLSFKGKIERKISFFLKPAAVRIYQDRRLRPNGHSITAVFRKG